MSNNELFQIQLVPMAEEDRAALAEAMGLLQALGRIQMNDEWEGWEVIEGLGRIRDRVKEYGITYAMPMPISLRTKKPLFSSLDSTTTT